MLLHTFLTIITIVASDWPRTFFTARLVLFSIASIIQMLFYDLYWLLVHTYIFHVFSSHFGECGVTDPSWMELKHFLNFLDAQFEDCEESIFCNAAWIRDELPGFKAFVVRFMLKMSKVSQVRLRNLRILRTY